MSRPSIETIVTAVRRGPVLIPPSIQTLILAVLPALLAVSVTAVAQERQRTDAIGDETVAMAGTTIIGNRELPKVLYIVPWKRARPGTLTVRPFSSLYDEVLMPLDPPVLRRQLNYFRAIEAATRDSPDISDRFRIGNPASQEE